MTKDLTSFFAQNAEKPKNITKVVSKRFKDADGNPVPFEFKPIQNSVDAEIRKRCIKKKLITVGKKKGQYEQDFDATKYQNLLVIESTVFPNFKDAKLQESYGVFGEEELYNVMLTPAEAAEAYKAAEEVNGYETDMTDLVEEVKN